MEDRKSLILWIKEHKKELIIAGVSIGILILIFLEIKNRDELKTTWEDLKALVKKPPNKTVGTVSNAAAEIPSGTVPVISLQSPSEALPEKIPIETVPEFSLETLQQRVSVLDTRESRGPSHPFSVDMHIRNLHEGWHASQEKLEEARLLGINLADNQTLVDGYEKKGAAA